MEGPEPVNVAEVARQAVADGADLLGVAGGDGTQALVDGLPRGTHGAGLSTLVTTKIEINADAARIPVGIDGEAVSLSTPVLCTIRPGALRVWVPRDRPGAATPKPPLNWGRLRHLAAPRTRQLRRSNSPSRGA